MLDIPVLNDVVELVLGLIAIGAAVAGWFRWGLPKYRSWRDRKASERELWHGRPAIPANPITGAPPQPAKPSIGQLVAEIWHELHPNGGSSMKDQQTRMEVTLAEIRDRVGAVEGRLEAGDRRFDEIDAALAGELHTAHDALANAAEASTQALSTIETAIKATPPSED